MSKEIVADTSTPASYTFTSFEKNDVEVNLKVNNVTPIDSAKYKCHRIACLIFMLLLNLSLLFSAIALMVTTKTCAKDNTLIIGQFKWWRTSILSMFDFSTDYNTFKTSNIGYNTIFIDNYIKLNEMASYLSNYKEKVSKLDSISYDNMNSVEIVINLGNFESGDGFTAGYFFNVGGKNYIDFSNSEVRKLLFDCMKNIMTLNINSFAISSLPKKKDSNGNVVNYVELLSSLSADLKFASYKQNVNWIYIGDEPLNHEESKAFVLVSKKLNIDGESLTDLATKLITHNQVVSASTVTDFSFTDKNKLGISIFVQNSLKFPLTNSMNILDVSNSRNKLDFIWSSSLWSISTDGSLIISKYSANNVIVAVIVYNGGSAEYIFTAIVSNVELSKYVNLEDNFELVGKKLAPNKFVVAKLK